VSTCNEFDPYPPYHWKYRTSSRISHEGSVADYLIENTFLKRRFLSFSQNAPVDRRWLVIDGDVSMNWVRTPETIDCIWLERRLRIPRSYGILSG